MCGLYPTGLEAALLEWKYRGALTGNLKMVAGGGSAVGAHAPPQANQYRQANTDKRIQAGDDAQVLNPAARAAQNHLGSS